MTTSYLVIIRANKSMSTYSVVCKDNNELATLMANLDTDNWTLSKIELVNEFAEDIKSFCTKPDNLETGDKKED